MNQGHVPVALERCVDLLTPAIEYSLINREKTFVIDATLGLGGHAFKILSKFPLVTVIGIDRDQSAIAIARSRLSQYSDRLIIAHNTYDQIAEIAEENQVIHVAGILFDLGVSSMQLDDGERGFAYSYDAPLDMRMDQSSGITAREILETYDRHSLIRILRKYGEEKFAPRIVDNIIFARENGSLNSTKDLAEIVKNSIPAPARRTGGNPAKRTFQALRIEVNQELSILEKAIPAALAALDLHGRLVVMSYQSLEDKIVKGAISAITESRSPRGLPFDLPNSAPKYTLIMRGSEAAPSSEIDLNSRAASMRLRAVERMAA